MTTLAALAERFATLERPAGNLLDLESVLAQATAAASFYAGYARITSRIPAPVEPPAVPAPMAAISGATEISESEWALIRPLFLLYIERETALQLEASRGMGMDVYGRSTGEVAGDITQAEAELPRLAFSSAIITI